MKTGILLLVLIVLFGCKEKEVKRIEIEPQTTETTDVENKFVVTDLTENGIRVRLAQFLNKEEDKMLKDDDFRFYRGQMSRDTVLDWVVTVNTLEYAKKTLTAQGNLMPIDYGYLGNYNHFFIINGETGKISGRPVGSSALQHLEIEIDYINTDQYQLAKIFFRLGTSKFIAIYNSSIPNFKEIFSWEVFNLSDKKNEGKPTASIIEFVGDDTAKKDILIYDAEVLNFNDQEFVDNMFSYNPELMPASNEPSFVFEYQLVEGKYGQINK